MSQSIWSMNFQDAITGPLRGLVGNIKSSFAQMEGVTKSFNDNIKKHGDTLRQNTDAANSFGGTIKRVFAAVGVFAIGREILQTGAAMEQTNTAFEVLLGSVDVAKMKVAELQKFADISPFNTTEVMNAGQSLLGFGVMQQNLLPIMNQLGDVSMGNSAKFSSMVDNYGKIVSAQRANTMDLNQFAIAGIPIWKGLEKQTGMSGLALRQYVEQNGVSVAQINAVLKGLTSEGGQYFDMMRKQSDTTAGRWSTFVSQLQNLGVRIFNALQPMINGLMEFGTAIMPTLEKAIMGVVNAFKWLVDFVKEYKTAVTIALVVIGALITSYYTMTFLAGLQGIALKAQILWMGITSIATGGLTTAMELLNLAFLANPVFWLIAGIAALIAVIIYCWNHFDGFRKFLYSLWGAVKEIFKGIGEIIWGQITAWVDYLKGFGKILKGIFTLDWDSFKEGLGDFKKGIEKQIPIKKVLEITGKVKEGWDGGSDDFAKAEQKKKDEAAAKENQAATPPGYDPKLVGGANTASTTTAGGSTGGSGSSSRNIYFNAQSLVNKIEIHSNNLTEGAAQIRDIVKAALIGALNDTEIALG
jgi:hypothetical protein